jgi:hypothetical protein
MNEHSRLDRDASQLGHHVTLLAGFIGAKIVPRGMDDKLGCTVRVPQREKRKCFRNFSTWGTGNGVSMSSRRPWEGFMPGQPHRSARSQPARTTRESTCADVRAPQL